MALEFIETENLANRYVELLQKCEETIYIIENLNLLMEKMGDELNLLEEEFKKRNVKIKETKEEIK